VIREKDGGKRREGEGGDSLQRVGQGKDGKKEPRKYENDGRKNIRGGRCKKKKESQGGKKRESLYKEIYKGYEGKKKEQQRIQGLWDDR